MNRLTLLVLASIPLAASTACALDTSEDVDDEKAVTNVAAADSIAGDSEIDGVDGADPVAAAKRFAEAPAKGCRTRTLDPSAPNVVHVALEGCSGRFDRHVLSGHLTVTFSANPDGTLHVAYVDGWEERLLYLRVVNGAVMGLIHVMENLSDPSKLGSGIAVAFVATIYGVGSANLIFLPVSKKLLGVIGTLVSMREMLVDGLVGIANGDNPRIIESRLKGYAG